MLAAHAIIDNPVLVYPNPAIDSWHKVFMAVLAKSFLERIRQPYFILHSNPSCHPDILVRKPAVFPEVLFG